jgi:hypothetical protein
MQNSPALQHGVAIALAIVGVATLAVIVSGKSNTSNVITASGNSFANAIRCALGPITGNAGCARTPVESVTSTINFGGLGL